MRTKKFSQHKTCHLHLKSILGLHALFYLEPLEFEDEALTGQFQQTFYGHARRSYHVLFSPIDYDLMEVWAVIKEHDHFNFGPP